MNNKTIIPIVSIAVIAVIAVAVFAHVGPEIQNQNPKIFCYAVESDTSGWYKTEKSPALSGYDVGAESDSLLPNVKSWC